MPVNRSKVRKYYSASVIALIVAGLLSRQIGWVPVETGDALWAMMVFSILRLLFPSQKLSSVALTALLISYLDEFSQLIQTDWLNAIRATTPGHLVLGQGFQLEDIVAYTLGILVIYLTANKLENRSNTIGF